MDGRRKLEPTESVPGAARAGETGDSDTAGLLPRGATIGRYVVIAHLGAGGMGVVYSAYDPDLDRRVAIKVLRPELRAEQSRLLREARAMARLSHPNVLSIHDVGLHHDRVFIAMELVDGVSLRQWLERPVPWRQTLQVLLQAGHGLAAAHGVGIVHRDFKPDNVMIGRNGSVRVLDFGVARSASAPTVADADYAIGKAITLSDSAGVVGTPAYMAPEQLAGEPADARADQFSFCVTLFQALAGRRPFAGETVHDFLTAIRERRIDPAAEQRIPAWIRAVLARGLSADPAKRYGSMSELLAALERDPAAARRRGIIAGGILLAIAGAAGTATYQSRRNASLACEAATNGWAGVWDAAAREQIRAAFVATRAPYAAAAFDTVARSLDQYARKWNGLHTDACRATWVRREQSEALLDLRMSCLNRRRAGVRALTELLAKADPVTVEKSVQATYALEDPQACADVASLEGPLPPPADRTRFAALRTELARATALGDTGKIAAALEVIKQLTPEARALGYAPFTGELSLLEGDLRQKLSDASGSASALLAAVAAATEGHDDTVAAQAAMRLVYTVGYLQQRLDEGRFWGEIAQAAIRRTGTQQPVLLARVLTNLATLAHEQGKQDEGVALLQRGIALDEAAEPDSPRLAMMLTNLAISQSDLMRNDEALATARRALEIRERTQGPSHPDLGFPLSTMAALLTASQRSEEAIPLFRRAIAIREASLGPNNWLTATSYSQLGDAQRAHGDLDEAMASYRQAIAIFERQPGPPMRLASGAYCGVGKVELKRGHAATAIPALEKALAIQEGAGGGPAIDSADIEIALAQALWDGKHDRRRALELAERARKSLASDRRYDEKRREAEAWIAAHDAAPSTLGAGP